MTRSEYLFGYKPEKYAHLQEPLAKMKIADAKELLTKLVPLKKYGPEHQDEFQRKLHIRINETLDAIRLWTKILEDGKD